MKLAWHSFTLRSYEDRKEASKIWSVSGPCPQHGVWSLPCLKHAIKVKSNPVSVLVLVLDSMIQD